MIGKKVSYFPCAQYSTLKQINKTYKGETALVFRTRILKDNLFPEIDGEKFISEGVVYGKLDSKYVLAIINEYWIDCEYQQGGLTHSSLKLRMKNPKGWALCSKVQYESGANNLSEKIKYASTFICASLVAKEGFLKIINTFPNRLMCILCFPLGILQFLKNVVKSHI